MRQGLKQTEGEQLCPSSHPHCHQSAHFPNPSSSSPCLGLPTAQPMPLTAKTKPGTTPTCFQKMKVWFQASGDAGRGRGGLLFSKRDTSLFSCTRITFHSADLAPHLNSIPQANNTIKQMERRFSNTTFHRTGNSFACSFKRNPAFRRINRPESHGLKHYIETTSEH